MRDFGEPPFRDSERSGDEPLSSIRQLVIRLVASLLLLSFLGTLYLSLRGIQGIVLVIGILAAVAVVASLAKKQRAAENPYATEDPPDLDIH